jgi:nucleoside phosphorylase
VIAITFALPTESSRLIARVRETPRTARSDNGIIYGQINQRPVAIFHTGVGQKACQASIDDFLSVEHPDFLISSGFAGGLREGLRVGDLFLAENFSDRQLLSTAQGILTGRNTQTAKLFTSASIIDSVSQRNELGRQVSADAVDMETETIARACATSGIRMLSLRVISDTPRQPLPAPPGALFDMERQKTDVKKLVTHTLKHPAAFFHLVAFARHVALARRALTEALIVLLGSDLFYT